MSDEELLRRYLLGDLPDDEQEALERRLLSEDDLFELAEALEAEVLEDYARGDLAPAQRERVDRYLAVSPEGRLRLALVRGLSILPAPAGRLLPFPGPPLERPRVRPQAIAALLVMAVGALLLARVHAPIRSVQDGNRAGGVGREIHRSEEGEGRIAQVTPAPVPPPPAPVVATPSPPPPVYFIADIVLTTLRGEEEVPSFDIPALTDVVELRLKLPAGDQDYPSYQVALKQEATGAEVTPNKGLQVKQSSGQLILRVDASRFEEGRYSLTVQGVTSEGEVEDLAFPEFEVR